VLGALSLATDLANGNPMESALRTALLASAIAREAGVSGEDASDAFYAALLRHVGCTAFAHEEAVIVGDELRARQIYSPIDPTSGAERLRATLSLGKGTGAVRRSRSIARVIARAGSMRAELSQSRCEVASRLAARLKMSRGVVEALGQMYERWDGRGLPNGLEGEAITLPARIVHLAVELEVHNRRGGNAAARDVARRRAGKHFDPRLVRASQSVLPALLAMIDAESVWDAALAADPGVSGGDRPRVEDLARAFADYVDLKSVYTLGHSSRVAALAERAGNVAGLDEEACLALRYAGLLHDLGRVSVSTAVWEKRGPLTLAEWERVRLHPYYTERILARSPLLAPYASIAGLHHERLDGSGYHRSAPASLQTFQARLLAAADFHEALLERRPHRDAVSPDEAARTLRAETGAGRLDRRAVDAVLGAAGHPVATRRSTWPAGLTDREVQVLSTVARGFSAKEVARQLSISTRTAQHHVAHIYRKIGVSSRAAAALFAMEHELLRE